MTAKKILQIEGLTKHFGKVTAVDNLNLEIEAGQVFGILGPNGSGKTTTLGMILDVVAPNSGSYSWFEGMKSTASRKLIGSILETPCFYPYLNAEENLRITAHIKGVPFSRIDPVLRQVNLYDRKHDNFKGFSLGMKQRLSIAAALLADPPVLILDEPTNGLDPEGIAEVRSLISDISKQGKTIILASHLLDEVQKVCTDFCVLKKGKKLHHGSIQDILGETNRVTVNAEDKGMLEKTLSEYENVLSINKEMEGFLLELAEGTKSKHVNEFCHKNGIVLTSLISHRNTLEQEFLKILN